MRKVKFKNDELLIERDISYITLKTNDKNIVFKNATKIIVERSIKGNMILLKSNVISKYMEELFWNHSVKIDVSLENLNISNAKCNEYEDITEYFGLMKSVYFYMQKPCMSNTKCYEYTVVLCSIDSNLDYDDIMKLVEREERQQLNSTIYKTRSTEVALEVKNVNENIHRIHELMLDTIGKHEQKVFETIKVEYEKRENNKQ